MAGALAVLVRTPLRSEFRRIDPLSARIVLVDMANRVLGTFADDLSSAARQRLRQNRGRPGGALPSPAGPRR